MPPDKPLLEARLRHRWLNKFGIAFFVLLSVMFFQLGCVAIILGLMEVDVVNIAFVAPTYNSSLAFTCFATGAVMLGVAWYAFANALFFRSLGRLDVVLRIDDAGIFYPSECKDVLTWDNISSVRVFAAYKSKYKALAMYDNTVFEIVLKERKNIRVPIVKKINSLLIRLTGYPVTHSAYPVIHSINVGLRPDAITAALAARTKVER